MFHGADNDVLWLQRDFHIYVVNLFDTAKVIFQFTDFLLEFSYLSLPLCWMTSFYQVDCYSILRQACEVLSKPQKSLAYLLETYCGVATNKLLQVWVDTVLLLCISLLLADQSLLIILLLNCSVKIGDNVHCQ